MDNQAQIRFAPGTDIEADGVRYLIQDCRTVRGLVYLTLQAPVETVKITCTVGGYQPTDGCENPKAPPGDE